MILYKYLPPERIAVLQRNLIRYTPPGAFNDPFESSPHLSAFADDETLRRLGVELLPQAREDIWARLPDSLKARVERGTLDALVSDVDVINSAASLVPTFRAQVTARVNEKVGILSLSARRDSLLMWAHYSAAHTGFVIGVDSTHPTFTSPRSPDATAPRLREVTYSSERPSRTLAELSPTDVFFTKSQEWGYEHEWRALERLQDAIETKHDEPWAIHLFNLPSECVREMVIGCRMTPKDEALVRSVLTESRYQHVRLLSAEVDDRHFALNVVPVAR